MCASRLQGYDELKSREQRLSGPLALLNGESPTGTLFNRTAPQPIRRRQSSSGGPGLADVDRELILAYIRTHPEAAAGATRDELGLKDQGIDSNLLSRVLKEMVDDGSLLRSGERRATRYSIGKP
jgi:hypothetical protein